MELDAKKVAKKTLQKGLIHRLTGDKKAGEFMNNKLMKVIYEFTLDLSYALLFLSMGMVVVFESQERQRLVNHFADDKNKSHLFGIAILAAMIVAFQKLSKVKELENKTRKNCNFIEDVLRSLVYILLLIILTPLALGKWQLSSKILQAYAIYLASGVLFLVMRLIKWYYYLCGQGKDQQNPWVYSQTQQKLTDKQKKHLQDMVSKIAGEKIEKKEGDEVKNHQPISDENSEALMKDTIK